jgi:hypothetical protein
LLMALGVKLNESEEKTNGWINKGHV